MTTNKKFNFKLGADPEFVLTIQKKKIDAQRTMSLMLKNKKDFSPSSQGFDIKQFGNLGWDGASSTAEIRPKPSNTPEGVVSNIGGMLKEFSKYSSLCDMSTLSEHSAVGGHIHLEVPDGYKRIDGALKNTIQRRLSSFYLPILITENKTNLSLRTKQGYGKINDMRLEEKFTHQNGNPGYTIEFRCPSAEWLTTPKIANATLAYMGVVYHEIMFKPETFKKCHDILIKSDKQGDALQTLALMEFKSLTKTLIKDIKKEIQKFEMYDAFKEEIEYIFNAKQVVKDKEKAEYNIALGWEFKNSKIPTKRELTTSTKKEKVKKTEIDIDSIKGAISVFYNQDENVGIFSDILKDKIATHNWKIKNNYYIFGMRKGIEKIIARNTKGHLLIGNSVIKTRLDEDSAKTLFKKMENKFAQTVGIPRNASLNFITGKIEDAREKTILIGIPYEMRTNPKTKEFMEIIWNLEKGKIEKAKRLINDTNLPLARQGKVYKVLTRQVEQKEEVVIDEGSISLNNHKNAIENTIEELSHEEDQEVTSYVF